MIGEFPRHCVDALIVEISHIAKAIFYIVIVRRWWHFSKVVTDTLKLPKPRLAGTIYFENNSAIFLAVEACEMGKCPSCLICRESIRAILCDLDETFCKRTPYLNAINVSLIRRTVGRITRNYIITKLRRMFPYA